MAGEVEVIKAVEGNETRRRNMIGNGLSIDRKRVAAYVRVSTDGEEQLQSFQSQKEYYQDKISKNKEWAMVGAPYPLRYMSNISRTTSASSGLIVIDLSSGW